jgi:hypothetical protein
MPDFWVLRSVICGYKLISLLFDNGSGGFNSLASCGGYSPTGNEAAGEEHPPLRRTQSRTKEKPHPHLWGDLQLGGWGFGRSRIERGVSGHYDPSLRPITFHL